MVSQYLSYNNLHHRRFLKKLASLAMILATLPTAAQEVAVKTNLLYDATTTPNLGVEVGLGGNHTLNLVYGLNPWKFDSDTHGERFAKHWVFMPEFRWWTCSRLNGHFFGVHAMGGQLNVSNVDLPMPGVFFSGVNLRKAVRDSRYQGAFAGAGITYGYQYPLSRHWNLEAEVGVGYSHVWYDRYPCGDCGSKLSSGHANYAGLTKLGLSIMYVF
ncbi:MAG: DUF3575 domain-containing protein [Muribaculaceae bacterium]|nr:DUF3575 domain-containing protein [Muribaculaceae bacterium]